MKMADILRNVADMLDQHGDDETQETGNMEKSADDFQHAVHDGAESGDQQVELTGVMIPPLQQKLEILKKSAGMDNVYDQGDELGDIKKLTGIKAVIQHEASEDNDVLG